MKTFEIILSVAIVFLGLILSYKWKKLKKFEKKVLSMLILLTIVMTIVEIKNYYSEKAKEEFIEKLNAKFGELEFESEERSKIMLGHRDHTAYFVAKDTSAASINDSEYGPMIKFRTKEGKLLVYIIIRDFDGEVIAVIDGDTWTVYDNDYEYNDDGGKAFELVTRGERKVFFQIEYKNELVHISGYFITPDGNGFVIYNLEEEKESEKTVLVFYSFKNKAETEKLEEFRAMNIPRLFKYPRDKYYGQRQ